MACVASSKLRYWVPHPEPTAHYLPHCCLPLWHVSMGNVCHRVQGILEITVLQNRTAVEFAAAGWRESWPTFFAAEFNFSFCPWDIGVSGKNNRLNISSLAASNSAVNPENSDSQNALHSVTLASSLLSAVCVPAIGCRMREVAEKCERWLSWVHFVQPLPIFFSSILPLGIGSWLLFTWGPYLCYSVRNFLKLFCPSLIIPLSLSCLTQLPL